MDKPKKILIIRTDRMGDLVLSTPVIKNLRFAFPDSQISFMCRPYPKNVIEENPYLDEVIVYDKYRKHKSIIATIKFAFSLRKKNFDWAIVLHPTNRVNLISFLAGIKLRIGWDKKSGFLLTHKLNHTKQDGLKHESEYNLDILKALDVEIKDANPDFILNKESQDFAEKLLKDNSVRVEDSFFVIHAWASCVSKRWPKKNFIELIGLLKKIYNPKIALIGGIKDFEIGDQIIKSDSDILDFRGKLNIKQLAAVIAKSDIFISNDSGPVHLAAALGVPVVSIFGRKNKGLGPRRWKPLGESSVYLHKDVGCSECGAHNCTKGFLCLKAITPLDVLESVKSLLGKVNEAE